MYPILLTQYAHGIYEFMNLWQRVMTDIMGPITPHPLSDLTHFHKHSRIVKVMGPTACENFMLLLSFQIFFFSFNIQSPKENFTYDCVTGKFFFCVG